MTYNKMIDLNNTDRKEVNYYNIGDRFIKDNIEYEVIDILEYNNYCVRRINK